MSEDQPLSPRARRSLEPYLEKTAVLPSQLELERAWHRANTTASTRRSPLRFSLAFVVSCALGVVGTITVLCAPPGTDALPPTIAVSPGTTFTNEGSTVRVHGGQVRVRATAQAREVVTAQLTVSLLRAQVLVDAQPGRTVLVVEEGSVVMREGSGERRLEVGERVVIPVELTVAPSGPVAGCETLDGAGLERCLLEAAKGDGLLAQTALFELAVAAHERGAHEQALVHLSESRRRFPEGALAPEVAIAIMLTHRALGHAAEADDAAAAFLERSPTDPRAADVARWRSQTR